MALVTTFSPLTTSGPGETISQMAGGTRLVLDSKANPAASAGHLKTTSGPERAMLSCGCGNERLNTVPASDAPHCFAVPNRILPDKVNPAKGLAPSLLV